jgi:hypothetical protein
LPPPPEAAMMGRLKEKSMKQGVIVASFVVLAAGMLSQTAASAAYTGMSKSNPDWPCQQILVRHLSAAAMWAGPPLKGADATPDPQIDQLASEIAQRRMPLGQAKVQIDALAKSAGPARKQKLTQLFALLFDQLDSERSQVISGLIRFGHRQAEMATKIRAENAKLHEEQDKYTSPEEVNSETPLSPAAKQLQWDLRIFQDQHKTLSYVCEVPVIIEQRLFSVGRQIQNDMN